MKKRILFHTLIITFVCYSCKDHPEAAIPDTIVAPSNLVYHPDLLQIQTGTIVSSVKPSIMGTHPLYFTLTSNPLSAGAISINSEGIITASFNLAAGIYDITVTVGNEAGTITFPNVYQIKAGPESITFTKHILPLITNRCSGCHKEDGEKNFLLYHEASANVDLILYRVQRVPGAPGYMPQDSLPLTSDEINLFLQWKDQGLIG